MSLWFITARCCGGIIPKIHRKVPCQDAAKLLTEVRNYGEKEVGMLGEPKETLSMIARPLSLLGEESSPWRTRDWIICLGMLLMALNVRLEDLDLQGIGTPSAGEPCNDRIQSRQQQQNSKN